MEDFARTKAQRRRSELTDGVEFSVHFEQDVSGLSFNLLCWRRMGSAHRYLVNELMTGHRVLRLQMSGPQRFPRHVQ